MEIISRRTTGKVYDAVIVGSGAAGGMSSNNSNEERFDNPSTKPHEVTRRDDLILRVTSCGFVEVSSENP
jgi:hypothetical protein